MSNFFIFNSENGTQTNIGEVTVAESSNPFAPPNENGYPIISPSTFNIGNTLQDGSNKGEGITSTNYNFVVGEVGEEEDLLEKNKALAPYQFHNSPGIQSGSIPSWCNYMKVFLIGGGGGGGAAFLEPSLFPGTPHDVYCGDGGGAGEWGLFGLDKPPGASTYSVNIGIGGAGGKREDAGYSGERGGSTSFSMNNGQIKLIVKGGNGGQFYGRGGLNSWPPDSGVGGGYDEDPNNLYQSTTIGPTNLINQLQPYPEERFSQFLAGIYKITGSARERAYGASVISENVFNQIPNYYVNQGGSGVHNYEDQDYGFSGAADQEGSDSALIYNMRGSKQIQYGGPFGAGGNGQTQVNITAMPGNRGCACVFFFPTGDIANYPISIPGFN